MINVTEAGTNVAKKKTTKPDGAGRSDDGESLGGNRVEFQAPASWIKRLDRYAKALGMGRSAYVRMAVNRQMALDDRAAGES